MPETDRNAVTAREYLEARGYVVLREKSYHEAQRRHAIARSERDWEIRARQSCERWAREQLGAEIRSLRDRVTFLYGAARAAGCTVEELAGHLGGES